MPEAMIHIQKKQLVYDWVIHLAFALLFIMAFIYFRERIFSDSSYYLAHVINSQGFRIEHSRLVLALSQWLPLVGVLLQLSLKTVIILYSIGHVLHFYLCWLWSRYGLSDTKSGLMLIALQTLGLIWGYFAPMFELYYGLALLVVFYSYWRRSVLRPVHWFAIIPLLVFALLSHPTAIPLFFMLLVYDFLNRQNRKDWLPYTIVVLLAIGLYIYKSQTATPYEQGKTAAAIYTLNTADFGWEYQKVFWQYYLQYYWELVLMVLVATTALLYKKHYIHAVVAVGFFLLMLFASNLNGYSPVHGRYTEQVYFPAVFVAAFVFIYQFMPLLAMRWKMLAGIALLLMGAYHLVLIGKAANEPFGKRTSLILELTEKAAAQGESKLLLPLAEFEQHAFEANWSLPIESLLLSSLQNDTLSVTLATDWELEKLGRHPEADEFIFRFDTIMRDTAANKRYFKIQHGEYIQTSVKQLIHSP